LSYLSLPNHYRKFFHKKGHNKLSWYLKLFIAVETYLPHLNLGRKYLRLIKLLLRCCTAKVKYEKSKARSPNFEKFIAYRRSRRQLIKIRTVIKKIIYITYYVLERNVNEINVFLSRFPRSRFFLR